MDQDTLMQCGAITVKVHCGALLAMVFVSILNLLCMDIFMLGTHVGPNIDPTSHTKCTNYRLSIRPTFEVDSTRHQYMFDVNSM